MHPAVVVDVGNTRIKWGRCAADRVTEMVSLGHDDQVAWEMQIQTWGLAPSASWVLSGTDPGQQTKLRQWLDVTGFKTCELASHRDLSLSVAVDHPEKVGLDRLLNAVAVNAVRAQQAAAIIIDAGTAVTVDFVDAAGVFQGGAILPGFRLMTQALHDYTAKLPLLTTFARENVPAKDTERALRAGVFDTVMAGVHSLIYRLEKAAAAVCEIFVGGGDGAVITPYMGRRARLWPEMTLEGIRRSVAELSPKSPGVR